MLERFRVGLDIFSKLEAELKAKRTSLPALKHNHHRNHSPSSNRYLIQSLVEQIGPLPPYALIIGARPDGFHLYLDLSDPRPGSILIAADPKSGKTRLLNAMLTSGCELNPVRRFRFSLVADRLEEYENVLRQPHCFGALLSYDKETVNDWLTALLGILEGRVAGHQSGCAILIAIDSLSRLVENLDPQMKEDFYWLVQNGPQFQMWTVATTDSEEAIILDPALSIGFETRLIGKISDAQLAQQISGSTELNAASLEAGNQFSVLFEKDWMNFWVPEVG